MKNPETCDRRIRIIRVLLNPKFEFQLIEGQDTELFGLDNKFGSDQKVKQVKQLFYT